MSMTLLRFLGPRSPGQLSGRGPRLSKGPISRGSKILGRLHRGGLQEGPGNSAEGHHQSQDLHGRRRPRCSQASYPSEAGFSDLPKLM